MMASQTDWGGLFAPPQRPAGLFAPPEQLGGLFAQRQPMGGLFTTPHVPIWSANGESFGEDFSGGSEPEAAVPTDTQAQLADVPGTPRDEQIKQQGVPDRYSDILRVGRISLAADAAAAARTSFDKWFKLVAEGGAWDFKNNRALIEALKADGVYDPKTLDEFGNFHFGMTAAARGYSLPFTLTGAGAYQSFVQGGGNPLGAVAAGAAWGSQFVQSALTAGVLDPVNTQIARGLTRGGFSWGDNRGDPINILDGWDYYHDR